MGANGPREMRNKFPNDIYLTSFGQDKGDQGIVHSDFDHGNPGQVKKGVEIWSNGKIDT
jgi:hypothetical protein